MDPHDPSMEQSLTTFSEFVPVASSQSTRNELQKLTPFSQHNVQQQPANSKTSARCNTTNYNKNYWEEQNHQPAYDFAGDLRMERTTEIRRRADKKLQSAYRMVNHIYRRSGRQELYPECGPISNRGELTLTPNDFEITKKHPPNSRLREFSYDSEYPGGGPVFTLPSIHRNLHPQEQPAQPPQKPKDEWLRALQTINNLKSLLG